MTWLGGSWRDFPCPLCARILRGENYAALLWALRQHLERCSRRYQVVRRKRTA